MIKKILIISSEFPPQPGGIGNHAFNLAKNLNINNFEVEVVTDQRILSNKEEKVFDSNLLFKIKRIPLRKMRVIMYFNRVFQVFKSISRNQIIIASGKFSLWIVALASLFYKRKFIAVIHGTEVNFKKNSLKKSIDFSLKRFDKVIAVSNYTKSLIAALQLEKVDVIPNGYNELNTTSLIECKLKGSPSLITVGSVTRRKGQQNVINAIPELLKIYPNLHYHIVGTPIEREVFSRIAEELAIEKYITFHGIVDEGKKQKLLKGSNIFVMLSENTKDGDVEGFGIALLEANSQGIPTIGAKDCGIEDAIDNGKSGILIDNKNHTEFIEAIEKIMSEYDFFKKEAVIWSSKFTWNKIIKKYIKALDF